MPGAQTSGKTSQPILLAGALLKPGSMHAITGSKHITAGNALMALYQIKFATTDDFLHPTRKAGITPPATKVKWIADTYIALGITAPCTSNQRDGQLLLA